MVAFAERWRAAQVGRLPVADVTLAAFLCAVAVASVLGRRPDEGPMALTLPVALVTTVAVVWRTRRPLLAVAVVTLASLAQALLGQAPGSLWSFAVFLLLTYSAAAHCSEGRAAAGGAVMVGGLFVQERVGDGVDYLFIVLVFGGTWLLGRAVRTWMSRARFAEQHQEDLARLAVAEERVRIARELHDVVAHGLSVIAVQADAAEAALDHDHDLARAPLRAIHASARESLRDMRQMLQVLRTDDETGGRRPAPGVADLDALVVTMRQAGLPLEARIDDTARGLPPAVDLAAYRVVQEALTNVLRHAGRVPTSLVVCLVDDRLDLRVSNGPAGPAGRPERAADTAGHGLLGIRERVLAAGGSLLAEPSADGGFCVRASVPVGAVAR